MDPSLERESMTLSERLPIAVNTFVWHSPLDDEGVAHTLPQIAEWGYDGVELALENVGDWDPARARELLEQHGLRAVVGAVFGPGRELVAADDEVVERTRDYVRSAVDVAVAHGAELVIGPMYTSVGRTWRLTADERADVVRDLRESYRVLGGYAADRGIRLAVEPLNRYETSLFNTTEQLLEVIDPLPREAIGLNLDTYHMNIEEASLDSAFDAAGDRLLHLQVCGNDRGIPLQDHQDWDAIRAALVRIDYSGFLGFESFTANNASIATAASIWRPFAPSQDDLARGALAELRMWRDGWPAVDTSGDSGSPDAR